jgi:hypothetical protein
MILIIFTYFIKASRVKFLRILIYKPKKRLFVK